MALLANSAGIIGASNSPAAKNLFKGMPPIQSANSQQTFVNQNTPIGGFTKTPKLNTGNATPASIGLAAKSPEQNLKTVTKPLPAAQVKAPTAPVAAKTTSAPKMATLYGPNGEKKAVAVGSSDASSLQGQGWGLTPGSSVVTAPKATTTGSIGINTSPAPLDTSARGLLGAAANSSNNGSSNTTSAMNGLMETAATNPAIVSPARQAYNDTIAKVQALQDKIAQATGNIQNAGDSLEVQTGQKANLQQQYGGQLQALSDLAKNQLSELNAEIAGRQTQQTGYSNAGNLSNTAQGLQQNGLLSAAGLAQPNQGTYSSQYFNPLTGQPVNGGGGSGGSSFDQLPQQAQDAVNSYAQQVRSGSMTRGDAESRLSAYGIVGTNALNEVLGSDFNTNASNASAGTTAVGQQLSAAVPPANQALDALQSAYNQLPGIQTTGIPALNRFLQNASMATGVGRTAVSVFQGALQEARSRIDAALAGVIGVDAAGRQSNALLPDDMVPSELPQKIANAKQYLQNQLKSYQGSGNQTQASTNSNSQYNW